MSRKQDSRDRSIRELQKYVLLLDDLLKAPSTRKLAEEMGIRRESISRDIRDAEAIAEKKLFNRIDGKGLEPNQEEAEFFRLHAKVASATHELYSYVLRSKFNNRHKNCPPFKLPYTNNFHMVPLTRGAKFPDTPFYLTLCKTCMVPFLVKTSSTLKNYSEGYVVYPKKLFPKGISGSEMIHSNYLYAPDFKYVAFLGTRVSNFELSPKLLAQLNRKERLEKIKQESISFILNPSFLDQLP